MARYIVGESETARQWRAFGLQTLLNDEPEHWPSPWREAWSKCSPRCHAVWTYTRLGGDLTGEPDMQRRNALQQCIAAAQWPRGAISFWPIAFPKNESTSMNSYMFLAGLRNIQPSLVVFFDDDSKATQQAASAISAIIPRHNIFFLPSLDAFDPEAHAAAVKTLPSP